MFNIICRNFFQFFYGIQYILTQVEIFTICFQKNKEIRKVRTLRGKHPPKVRIKKQKNKSNNVYHNFDNSLLMNFFKY